MIEIEFGKEGGKSHVIAPLAWYGWPATFLSNRWNDLKEIAHSITGGKARITKRFYGSIYYRRDYVSPADRAKLIAHERRQYEERAPEREAFMRSIKRRHPLDGNE